MIRIGHAFYQTPCKPLPTWLFYVLFWTIIPPMIVAVIAWEMTKGLRNRVPSESAP
jgi:hypothetical protein